MSESLKNSDLLRIFCLVVLYIAWGTDDPEVISLLVLCLASKYKYIRKFKHCSLSLHFIYEIYKLVGNLTNLQTIIIRNLFLLFVFAVVVLVVFGEFFGCV